MARKLNKPRVLGVLAGGDMPHDRLISWARSADIILAADGAADSLYSYGIIPDIAVGDMDSISSSTKDRLLEVAHIDDQDHSDCDKLLSLAASRDYGEVTLIGAEGDLLDHVLGSLFSAAKAKVQVRFALRRGIAHILRGQVVFNVNVPPGTRLSLMPIVPCSGVCLKGTQWPLENADLSGDGLVSLSNRALGPIAATIHSGVAALFLAHSELEKPAWD